MSETLFIGTNGMVMAIDSSTGRELWRTKLGGGGLFSSSRYQDVAIVEHEDSLFAGANGKLYCLDKSSGRTKWNNELSGAGYNDLCLSIAGKRAFTKSPEKKN